MILKTLTIPVAASLALAAASSAMAMPLGGDAAASLLTRMEPPAPQASVAAPRPTDPTETQTLQAEVDDLTRRLAHLEQKLAQLETQPR